MTKCLPLRKFPFISMLIIFFISCGDDMVEDVIETYESGNKKVYVRYHPDVNVLEKHFYNSSGEMIHLERDSLSYGNDFKQFMLGTWIIDKMMVDGGMGLIFGGTLFISYQLDVYFPLVCLILCGVCIMVHGLKNMID